ncbi:MAG: hypothetical protein ACRDT7_18435 [Microbacterium sp.]
MTVIAVIAVGGIAFTVLSICGVIGPGSGSSPRDQANAEALPMPGGVELNVAQEGQGRFELAVHRTTLRKGPANARIEPTKQDEGTDPVDGTEPPASEEPPGNTTGEAPAPVADDSGGAVEGVVETVTDEPITVEVADVTVEVDVPELPVDLPDVELPVDLPDLP